MTLTEFLKEVECVEISITSYTEAEALEEVKQDGHALKYVHNQTEEICLAAVKQNGSSLAYVQKQTKEICLTAVKQDGYIIGSVDKSIFDAEPSIILNTITLNGLTYVLQV